MRTHPLLIALVALVPLACDDGPAAPIDAAAPTDMALDAAPDARPDIGPDAGPDAMPDGSADATRDAAPDATVDAELDADVMGDAIVDAEIDAIVDAGPPPYPLRISELMARNDGTWVDEIGEADDWIELINASDDAMALAGHLIGDDNSAPHVLPDVVLEPGEVILLWADDDVEAGPHHLPFKLSGGGETVRLFDPEGSPVEQVVFPELEPDEAWSYIDGQWDRCRHATPDAPNPDRCSPAAPPGLDSEVFEPYRWSDPWPAPPSPLTITELALRSGDDAFIEVLNRSDAPVALAEHILRVTAHQPGQPWPDREGPAIGWPLDTLDPGERVAVPITPVDLGPLAADPLFEGVVQLWAPGRDYPLERIDFMSWPDGAALTRHPREVDRHVFCQQTTRGEPNDACDPVESRAIDPDAGRLRHLRTPGDASGLAEGGVEVGVASVKFVMDLQGGSAVHLLSARRWDLHYTFAREVIDGLPRLDRCDAAESREFNAGWSAWSRINYFDVDDRRYLLGTIAHHAGPDLRAIEFASGDLIESSQMRLAFFGVMGHVTEPQAHSIRPRTAAHLERVREIEGRVPIVGTNAPYRGLTWQPLTQTVGYGVLRFVPADALHETVLGPQTIVVTDEVPNDIALVGGLITEAFQTPLAHVNLLSRNRDTPNMALPGAREHPDVAPLFGELVRLDVAADGWRLTVAEPAEAQAFWDGRRADGPLLRPRIDPTVRGVVPLADRGLGDLPAIGAKAAQLAELGRVEGPEDSEVCPGPVRVPADAMAIPLVHGMEHVDASGARARLVERQADPRFGGDPRFRSAALAEVRLLIANHPVEGALLAEVEAYIAEHFAGDRVRFRSSSNTEDLPGFNGAGLYTSVGVDPGESVEDAVRAVWASLFLDRGWDERDYFGIDQDGVAMAVLVHRAFPAERANGVGISRNVLEPIRRQDYLNVQHGEALVTNPAPGVGTEQIIHDTRRRPRIRYLARSTLRHGAPVLSDDEIAEVGCTLKAIHDHFRPLLDPAYEDRWFAMDIEFKHLGPARDLLVKQARPYSFGRAEVPADCRSL